MSSERISSEQWNLYQQWQRHLLNSRPVIPKGFRRVVLLQFCHALAFDSAAGIECFKSDARIAKEIGIDRKYLKNYRRLAIELGWFEPTGVKHRRVDTLRISLPVVQVDVKELAETFGAMPSGELAEVGTERTEPRRPRSNDPDPWADSPEEPDLDKFTHRADDNDTDTQRMRDILGTT